jgi:hypothetical protein
MADLKDLVGKRILIKESGEGKKVYEAEIEEVSPSGRYMKLAGGGTWNEAKNYEVVEELPPIKAVKIR